MHSHSSTAHVVRLAHAGRRTRRFRGGMLAGLLMAASSVAFATDYHGGNITYGTIVPARTVEAPPVAPPVSPPVAAPSPVHPASAASSPEPLVKPAQSACRGTLDLPYTIQVPLGKSLTMGLPEPVRARTVGNKAIVQTVLISPRSLYVLGSAVGTTNMFIEGRSGSCGVIDIVVSADPSSLQQSIRTLMPGETGVRVKSAAGALVLTGKVSDAVQAQRIVQLAEQFITSVNQAVPGGGGWGGQGKVINMLQVAAPQQVLLEVKVAEVSKSLIKKLGVKSNLFGGIGNGHFSFSGAYGMDAAGLLASTKGDGKSSNSLSVENRDVLIKILAEPNLMAISGQPAEFLAGGKLFLPMPQTNGTVTLQEESFGVGLKFTPTVLDNGRINLQVAPEVSELSQNGSSMTFGSGSNQQSWNLPIISTRRAATTIQIFDGQSFAIGGLMKNNVSGELKSLPLLGDLPLIGALFRSTSYQNDKTELVFIVTPRLVKALPEHYPLPTDSFGEVNAGPLFMNGNMEGQPVRPSAAQTPVVPQVLPAADKASAVPSVVTPAAKPAAKSVAPAAVRTPVAPPAVSPAPAAPAVAVTAPAANLPAPRSYALTLPAHSTFQPDAAIQPRGDSQP